MTDANTKRLDSSLSKIADTLTELDRTRKRAERTKLTRDLQKGQEMLSKRPIWATVEEANLLRSLHDLKTKECKKIKADYKSEKAKIV